MVCSQLCVLTARLPVSQPSQVYAQLPKIPPVLLVNWHQVFCLVPYFSAAISTLYTRSKILELQFNISALFAFFAFRLGTGLENLGSMELWRVCALLKSIFENFPLFNGPLLLLIIISYYHYFLQKEYVFWRKFPCFFRDRRSKWSEIAESIAIFLGNEKKSQDRNFSAILTMPGMCSYYTDLWIKV